MIEQDTNRRNPHSGRQQGTHGTYVMLMKAMRGDSHRSDSCVLDGWLFSTVKVRGTTQLTSVEIGAVPVAARVGCSSLHSAGPDPLYQAWLCQAAAGPARV